VLPFFLAAPQRGAFTLASARTPLTPFIFYRPPIPSPASKIYADCRDRTQLFEKIRRGTLEFPAYLSPEAKEILVLLLERDPTKRLGCGPGDAADIKRQPFFKTVDWDALFYCRLPPPFVPQIMSSMDTSQFDAEFTSMPIISPSSQKEAPLGMSVAAKFEGFSFVAPHAIPPHLQQQLAHHQQHQHQQQHQQQQQQSLVGGVGGSTQDDML
jgi:serine/threonine protein kinase